MKVLYRLFLIFILGSTVLFAQSSIKAMKVLGNVSNIGPTSKAWLSSSYQDVVLYPQIIDTNESNMDNGAKKVKVKAIYDGENISFLIKWKDEIENSLEENNITSYGDGFSIQFPVDYKDVKKLPYVLMGSKGRTVVVHTLKTVEDNETSQDFFWGDLQNNEEEVTKKELVIKQEVFVSEGTFVRTQIEDKTIKMQMILKNGYWRGTLSRSLQSNYINLNTGAFPIAFLVWNKNKQDRKNSKLLSSWIGVKLVAKSGGVDLVNKLSTEAQGDVVNGEKLALENCAACHNYGSINIAPNFMAPNLSNIGGYSTKGYLVESIVNPNAIVIVEDDKNFHKNFSWYDKDKKGNITSTMPAYDWLDKKSINDLVVFFKTLKAKIQ